jgi:hypothetical protein
MYISNPSEEKQLIASSLVSPGTILGSPKEKSATAAPGLIAHARITVVNTQLAFEQPHCRILHLPFCLADHSNSGNSTVQV